MFPPSKNEGLSIERREFDVVFGCLPLLGIDPEALNEKPKEGPMYLHIYVYALSTLGPQLFICLEPYRVSPRNLAAQTAADGTSLYSLQDPGTTFFDTEHMHYYKHPKAPST